LGGADGPWHHHPTTLGYAIEQTNSHCTAITYQFVPVWSILNNVISINQKHFSIKMETLTLRGALISNIFTK
jgi:hypothetical protein